MKRGPGIQGRLLAVSLALLAACAEVPPVPTAVRVSPQDDALNRAIAKHQQLAQQHKQSGDLAGAAVQWQILTVLAPRDETYRRELAETRAAIERRAREHLAAGIAALKSGDTDRAADAMLRVLALDPDNAEAAQALRDIEKRRAARTQASRAARAGGVAAAAYPATRPAASRASTADAADAYSLEQPLEIFKADTAGGLRELRQFVDANPNDKAARNRIGAAVYDRAKELDAQGQREQALSLYEQAVALRGDAAPGWATRIQALKKSLGK